VKADGDKLDEPLLLRGGDTASADIEQPDGSADRCGAPSGGDANAESTTALPRPELPPQVAALFARHPRLAHVFAGKAEGIGADGQELGSPESYDLELATKLSFKGVTDPDLLAAVLRRRPDGHARGSGDDYIARIIARALDVVDRGVADEADDPDRAALPNIVIDVDEERVNDEAVAALATHPEVYRRGSELVQIATDPGRPGKAVRRQPGSPRIVILKPATIREMLASRACWLRWEQKKLVPIHPPGWSVAAVAQRAGWPGVRLLEAVVETPVLRADGTVLEAPGYDAETGLYFKPPEIGFPPVPVEPTKDDAIRARDLLLDVVVDFPFATPAHKAAWLSGVLTPVARHAFDGPTPLTLIDGNLRGVGKSLLCDTFGLIVTGRPMARMPHVDKDDEMRKRITALAIAGDPMILVDNVAGTLGGPSLDAALTSVEWKDRILGESRTITVPFCAIWYATGNNVVLGADTVRRCLHVRLETPEEKPEERSGFQHPNLGRWIAEIRTTLVTAALTLLRAYFVAGAPDQALPTWGSFEGWSQLVRNCIVWLGLADPGGARKGLAESADRDAALIQLMIEGLDALTGEQGKSEFTASQIIAAANRSDAAGFRYESLAEAVATMADKAGKITPNSVGNRLAQIRNRVVDGKRLECRNSKRGTLWSISGASRKP
jgi:hypothetical protein